MVSKVKNKWDKLDDKAKKWASRLTAVATIIGVLAAAGGWIINQLDNAVATRIEAQTQTIQQEVQEIGKEREATAKQTNLQLTRLELMMLMETDPENVIGIERLARKYFSPPLDGNSYMTAFYTKWAKIYGGDLSLVLE